MKPVHYFKALADETRLRILSLLTHQEFNVNELVEILGMGQPRISRHLKILSECGLVKVRRDGLWAFYSVVAQGDGRRFLNSVVYLFEKEPEYLSDLERAKRVIMNGQEETRRFFDAMAEDWDAKKRNIIGDFDVTAEIMERIVPCPVAVDLGCGTGDLLPPLLRKAQTVIGVDFSAQMLKKAWERFPEENEKIDLRIGQLEHLPLRDGEADTGVINMVLHHLPSPMQGIEEAYRALKAKGSLILVDLWKHEDETMRKRYGDRWFGFAKGEIENWFEMAGFEIAETAEFSLKRGLKALLYRLRKNPN